MVAAVQAVRQRRVLVAWICVLASVIGFVACFAVWVNRQALNANNWSNVSGELLENPRVEQALSAYLVSQLFSSVNVEGELKSVLPTQAQGLSGPVAAGLRALADRAVPRLLASPQVHEAWRKANHAALEQLLAIIKGGGKVVSTENGEVSLNLRLLIVKLASQLGLKTQLESVRQQARGAAGEAAKAAAEQKLGVTLPPATGRLIIMRSNQLKTAQDIGNGIRGLAILLPLLSLALFALAIWLASGWRRLALRKTGWCMVTVGVLLLVARRIGGEQVVNSLVKDTANRPAADAVWSIGTQLLRNISVAVVIYGLLLVAAAWLSGETRAAVFIRRGLAPRLRDHAAGAYLAAAGVLLLIVLWGPTPATRKILPVIGFAALFALGVTVLRRQTAREFPDAQPGDAIAALRQGAMTARAGWLSPDSQPSGTEAPRQQRERPPDSL